MCQRDNHKCPVEGCAELIPLTLSLCIRHWKRLCLPQKLDLIRARESGAGHYEKLLGKAIRRIERREREHGIRGVLVGAGIMALVFVPMYLWGAYSANTKEQVK